MTNMNEKEIEATNGAIGAVLVIVGPLGPLIAAAETAKEAAGD